MDLERISVVLRPRGSWESMDLGLALLNANRRAVWITWAVTVMPVYAGVWLALYRWPWAAFLVLWWLKPLFDRVPLLVLSEALFGREVSPRRALATLRQAARPHLLRSLTLSRLSPSRSFLLPIWQLEGHSAASVLRRERVLSRATLGPAASLMAVCAGLEQCFTLSGLSFIFMFMPENLEMDAMSVFEAIQQGVSPLWFSVALGLVHALAVAFVEPLYVAAGFGLYVNRRTLLEGWDVELGFRRLVQRLGPTLAVLLALAMGGPAALADTGGPSPVEQAAARAGDPVDREALAEEARQIVSRPEFPHKETRFTFKLPEPEPNNWNFQLPFGPLIAAIMQAAAYVALAIGLGLLVRALLRWKRKRSGQPEEPELDEQIRLPAILADMGELPADVAGTAWRWWREGRHAEALGLLYRAALLDLVKLRGVALAEGDTESDCLSAARPTLPPASWSYLSVLTAAWQATAYAHRLPEDSDVRALCDGWPQHFRRTS